MGSCILITVGCTTVRQLPDYNYEYVGYGLAASESCLDQGKITNEEYAKSKDYLMGLTTPIISAFTEWDVDYVRLDSTKEKYLKKYDTFDCKTVIELAYKIKPIPQSTPDSSGNNTIVCNQVGTMTFCN